jgi:putative ATPase
MSQPLPRHCWHHAHMSRRAAKSTSATLFAPPAAMKPLAERMRPQDLDEMVGQERLLGPGTALRRAIESGHLHSMILWGPPGCGKTTLALLLARYADAEFESMSAVLCGLPEVRDAVARAQARADAGRRTVLFIDEVHRFNKVQQDAFLPHVERGTLILVGATTENPSFELNSALLSRCRVHVMDAVPAEAIESALRHALSEPGRGLGDRGLVVDGDSLREIARAADGDVRRGLTLLEIAADLARDGRIDAATLEQVLADRTRRFDKGGEQFYDQISALHKSVRSSDPDAALYWFTRLLDGGCDPHYLARRLVRMAIEDVGLADPRALALAIDAWQAWDRLGSPEGDLALAEVAIYLALAPRSNAAYVAFGAVRGDVSEHGTQPVPMALRNAPTRLMKELGYGKGYQYDHDLEGGVALGQQCLPEILQDRSYYQPVEQGLEIRLREKLAALRAARGVARGVARNAGGGARDRAEGA